ncbi:hypothetical protein O181_119682 [Austropuccinia psidii MF-1]|uniref:Uncharacterized protein n=1 Tax=Austropuccinia psidii MF-1 TaxID=1389203 RepID=A0A9Q3Q1N4_9BASI|nr:hypothetical protein [Austropuccinia psidii MF-1]
MPQDPNPPLQRPPLSRDPYETPLSPNPPIFQETFKFTHERLQAGNAVAFCEEERGLLKHSYRKPYKITVIPQEPWQKKPIPIPKSILPQFTESIRERIRTGLYEQSTSSYTSPIFCVSKLNGKLRIFYDLQELNKVTIKDAGLPPHTEEFVDAFAGRACYGLGYIMGGYDERE